MPSTRSFTLFLLLGTLLFLSLGTWQLYRREEKANLLEALAQAQKSPPHDVDTLANYTFPQPLRAQGHFVKGKSILLSAKTYQGKLGVYVLDVFQTKGGYYVLVQRGWAKETPAPPPLSPLTLKGIGRTPAPPTSFQPENTPPTYYWIDLKRLSKDLSLPLLPYYIISEDSYGSNVTPTDPFPSPSNRHLSYALTWYALAFFLGGMLWYRKHSCKGKERK